MQEFSSISVSSYEAGSLAERLTEQSRDGWDVVSIVPTGNTVTAYLCREASSAVEAHPDEPAIADPDGDEPAVDEPAEQASEPEASEPIDQPILGGIATATPATDTSTDSADDTSDASAMTTGTATSAGAAPAGWYADPSGRFELRYWDGGQWTEHVSRAGQQYTDPPVA